MSNTIDLVVISNEEKIFDGKVLSLKFNTNTGPIMIMKNHVPYLSKIDTFIEYEITENNNNIETNQQHIDISSGFVYTNGSVCFAIVEK